MIRGALISVGLAAVVVAAVASVPIRTSACERSFRSVEVGDAQSILPSRLGDRFHVAEGSGRWLRTEREYTCYVWPVPKVWAVGVSAGRVAQKELLVSP